MDFAPLKGVTEEARSLLAAEKAKRQFDDDPATPGGTVANRSESFGFTDDGEFDGIGDGWEGVGSEAVVPENSVFSATASVSVARNGEFVAYGQENRIVVLQDTGGDSYTAHLLSESVILDDALTQVCVVGIAMASNRVAPEQRVCILAGYASGYIRAFTLTGELLLSQKLHNEPVIKLRLRTRSQPASVVVDHTENLTILYPRIAVCINGLSLYSSLRACMRANAHDAGAEVAIPSLEYTKWEIGGQDVVADVLSLGLAGPPLSITSGNKATVGRFITVGYAPMIGYCEVNTRQNAFVASIVRASTMATQLGTAVLSLAKSWWAAETPADPAAEEEERVEPAVILPLRHHIGDAERRVVACLPDPSGRIALLTDSLGRITLLATAEFCVVRMWKGYRDAQVAFIEQPRRDRDKSVDKSKRAAVLLAVFYAPRRNIVEVWRLRHGGRVCAVTVPEGCALVQCSGILGTNPSTNNSRSLAQAVLIHPDGSMFAVRVTFTEGQGASAARLEKTALTNFMSLTSSTTLKGLDSPVSSDRELSPASPASFVSAVSSPMQPTPTPPTSRRTGDGSDVSSVPVNVGSLLDEFKSPQVWLQAVDASRDQPVPLQLEIVGKALDSLRASAAAETVDLSSVEEALANNTVSREDATVLALYRPHAATLLARARLLSALAIGEEGISRAQFDDDDVAEEGGDADDEWDVADPTAAALLDAFRGVLKGTHPITRCKRPCELPRVVGGGAGQLSVSDAVASVSVDVATGGMSIVNSRPSVAVAARKGFAWPEELKAETNKGKGTAVGQFDDDDDDEADAGVASRGVRFSMPEDEPDNASGEVENFAPPLDKDVKPCSALARFAFQFLVLDPKKGWQKTAGILELLALPPADVWQLFIEWYVCVPLADLVAALCLTGSSSVGDVGERVPSSLEVWLTAVAEGSAGSGGAGGSDSNAYFEVWVAQFAAYAGAETIGHALLLMTIAAGVTSLRPDGRVLVAQLGELWRYVGVAGKWYWTEVEASGGVENKLASAVAANLLSDLTVVRMVSGETSVARLLAGLELCVLVTHGKGCLDAVLGAEAANCAAEVWVADTVDDADDEGGASGGDGEDSRVARFTARLRIAKSSLLHGGVVAELAGSDPEAAAAALLEADVAQLTACLSTWSSHVDPTLLAAYRVLEPAAVFTQLKASRTSSPLLDVVTLGLAWLETLLLPTLTHSVAAATWHSFLAGPVGELCELVDSLGKAPKDGALLRTLGMRRNDALSLLSAARDVLSVVLGSGAAVPLMATDANARSAGSGGPGRDDPVVVTQLLQPGSGHGDQMWPRAARLDPSVDARLRGRLPTPPYEVEVDAVNTHLAKTYYNTVRVLELALQYELRTVQPSAIVPGLTLPFVSLTDPAARTKSQKGHGSRSELHKSPSGKGGASGGDHSEAALEFAITVATDDVASGMSAGVELGIPAATVRAGVVKVLYESGRDGLAEEALSEVDYDPALGSLLIGIGRKRLGLALANIFWAKGSAEYSAAVAGILPEVIVSVDKWLPDVKKQASRKKVRRAAKIQKGTPETTRTLFHYAINLCGENTAEGREAERLLAAWESIC